MKSRPYRADDLPAIERIFAQQGFEYQLPDLKHPSFLIKEVIVDSDDVPVQIVMARQTVEIYVMVDHTWSTPRWRWEAVRMIHEVVRRKLVEMNIQDVHAWLAPPIERAFGRRLMRSLGWFKPLWTSYSRKTQIKEWGE